MTGDTGAGDGAAAADATGSEPEESGAAKPGVGRFLYNLALAGVGSFMLAQEEIGNLLRRDAEAGEDDAEAAGDAAEGTPPEEPAETAAAPADESAPSPEPASPAAPADEAAAGDEDETPAAPHSVDAAINRVLHTFSIASRADLEDFTARLEALESKVAALRAARS